MTDSRGFCECGSQNSRSLVRSPARYRRAREGYGFQDRLNVELTSTAWRPSITARLTENISRARVVSLFTSLARVTPLKYCLKNLRSPIFDTWRSFAGPDRKYRYLFWTESQSKYLRNFKLRDRQTRKAVAAEIRCFSFPEG